MIMRDLFRYMYYLYIIVSFYIFIVFFIYFDVLVFKEVAFFGDLEKGIGLLK